MIFQSRQIRSVFVYSANQISHAGSNELAPWLCKGFNCRVTTQYPETVRISAPDNDNFKTLDLASLLRHASQYPYGCPAWFVPVETLHSDPVVRAARGSKNRDKDPVYYIL